MAKNVSIGTKRFVIYFHQEIPKSYDQSVVTQVKAKAMLVLDAPFSSISDDVGAQEVTIIIIIIIIII